MAQDDFRDRVGIFNRVTGLDEVDPFVESEARRQAGVEKLKAQDHSEAMRGIESDSEPSYSRLLPFQIRKSDKRRKEKDDEAYLDLILAQFDQWYRDVTAQLDARLAQIDRRLDDLAEVEHLVSARELDLSSANHNALIQSAGLTHEELINDSAGAINRRRQELWNQRDAVETIKSDLERDIDSAGSKSDLENIMKTYDERIQLTFAAQDAENQVAAGQDADKSYVDHDNGVATAAGNELNAFFPGQGR